MLFLERRISAWESSSKFYDAKHMSEKVQNGNTVSHTQVINSSELTSAQYIVYTAKSQIITFINIKNSDHCQFIQKEILFSKTNYALIV